MKISELAKAAGAPKETIHFYIREGLLPKPRKKARNVAEYDDSYIERIKYIKELQDKHFLPLSEIKKIVKRWNKGSPVQGAVLQLQSEYFSAVERLLPGEIKGEENFRKATGLSENWLVRMEEWGVITPETIDGEKVYSQDDVSLGKVICDMDRVGLGPKDGFEPGALREYKEDFKVLTSRGNKYFFDALWEKVDDESFHARAQQGMEIMSIFYYHLYRKLAKQTFAEEMEKRRSESSQ
ncbi:DNA-binding transcriptional regulator, MerR family [Desulfatibacillum alkenivorans DSM 16219]|jgi:DNA-binding transcriptional MerR regulator|uniref:DNA-binding transcriptional regulator, MerR family n=1 Tax=Desulfatibacillum alkenivorans DSM 16219 TaxID=1121393 RepID=A0A1M6IF38_9BACT|nr:MerR family transcriptional regulator [Desulfatibacillum alkenivorans]SHJ33035.1 DNA-binding transcriptional regulator, MerR family [Desulfatibacillum alkenivorans DSM 16219]